MKRKSDSREEAFISIADEYKGVIARVCSVYASDSMPFADLYQEVMINLWQGLDGFRGDAKVSTWIYRLALNTCITVHRRTRRHIDNRMHLDAAFEIPDNDHDVSAELRELYELIARLNPIDKAIVTMWLDENSYDEIAVVVGISKANVATRLHRAKQQLAQMAEE